MMKKDEVFLAGALRRLFKNRFILRSRGEQWFQIIVDNQNQIRDVLEKMGATLELNETMGLAFVKPFSQEHEDLIDYQLGTAKNLTRFSSMALIFLRERRLAFYKNPGNEERPLVKTQEIREYLNEYNFQKEDRLFQKEFLKTVGELMDLQILLKFNGDDLFEISPVCDTVLPADQVRDLKLRMNEYVQHRRAGGVVDTGQEEEADHVG